MLLKKMEVKARLSRHPFIYKTSCENIHPIALTSPAIRFALNPNRFRLLR